MLVSRKNLSFIHFVSRIWAIGPNGPPEPLHQGGVLLGLACLLGELDEPFAERVIKGTLLSTRELTCLINQLFICAECNILHTNTVYTIFVYAANGLFSREGGAARKLCGGAQLFLDTQKLVVLGDAVGAGG